MKESILLNKSKAFSYRIVRLYKYLCAEKKEYILSKQVLRSGTSIGANISEAQYAHGIKDFISKLSIAEKETGETEYWITILCNTGYITQKQSESLLGDLNEIIRMLAASIITSRKKLSY
jgi:four helix bundle protein